MWKVFFIQILASFILMQWVSVEGEVSNASAKTEREHNRPWHQEPLEGSTRSSSNWISNKIFIGQGHISAKFKQAFSEK